MILLSSGNESKEVKSFKVAIRSQALKDATQQMDREGKCEKFSCGMWKAHHQRRMAIKKCRENKNIKEQKS